MTFDSRLDGASDSLLDDRTTDLGREALPAFDTFGLGGLPPILAGKYLLLSLLGEGGMGRVYRVRHLLLACERALKTIGRGHSRADLLHRFEREAHALASFRHPHVVVVHDMGMDRGLPYIEMDLLDGHDLSWELRMTGPLPPRRALRLALQLVDALEAAHAKEIVHRDLKPSNLILEPSPRGEMLRVLDFGLAKLLDSDTFDGLRTPSGAILGTLAYMSPEQAAGRPADPRSDLYSTGVLLYECLTGLRPFVGPPMKLLRDHLETPAPPFPRHLGLSDSLERLVLDLLAKDPAERPQSAAELYPLLLKEHEACPPLMT